MFLHLSVILFTGQRWDVHGEGAMHGERGVHGEGGMHGRGHVWQGANA